VIVDGNGPAQHRIADGQSLGKVCIQQLNGYFPQVETKTKVKREWIDCVAKNTNIALDLRACELNEVIMLHLNQKALQPKWPTKRKMRF